MPTNNLGVLTFIQDVLFNEEDIMKKIENISDAIVKVVKNSKKSKKMSDYQRYREHLKTQGLLREDSYDWSIKSGPQRDEVAFLGRFSKNAILNNS